jgi:heme/copper-type cytochrome/quinol oxidase subunit 2
MAEENKSKTTPVLLITCVVVVIIGILIIILGVYLTSRYLTNLNNSANSQSQTKSGNSTYTNNEWKFSVDYPSNYTKDEDSNGMGAEFVSPNQNVTLRAFSVLAAGHSTSQYLDGIFDLAKDSLPGRTVTQTEKSPYKLGNLDGEMRVWKYSTGSSTKAEVRIAASNNTNMYNISLTCSYDEIVALKPIIEDMAQSFKTK